MAELPFTLMHPKPEEQYFDRPSSSSGSHKSESLAPQSSGSAAAAVTVGGKENGDGGVLIDTNLIQLDTWEADMFTSRNWQLILMVPLLELRLRATPSKMMTLFLKTSRVCDWRERRKHEPLISIQRSFGSPLPRQSCRRCFSLKSSWNIYLCVGALWWHKHYALWGTSYAGQNENYETWQCWDTSVLGLGTEIIFDKYTQYSL